MHKLYYTVDTNKERGIIMQVRKIDKATFDATPTKTETAVKDDTMIIHWNEDKAPERIKKVFSVPAMYYLTVPLSLFEMIIGILRGNNPQKKRYDYVTKAQQNHMIIAVRYDIVSE
jgi:hypothetical protein